MDVNNSTTTGFKSKNKKTWKNPRFEDLDVWKRARELCIRISNIMRESRDWAFRDQMIRSSLSISSNIAEGHERGSNKDFIRFLYIARGSCGELRTQLDIAREVHLIPEKEATEMIDETKEISAMIVGLIRKRSS